MHQKLFDEKRGEKRCGQCAFGRVPGDGSEVLCPINGVVSPEDSCKKFRYDPLKRVPKKIRIASDFSEDDFKL